ncbi:glycosyltransferase family 2 protein [Halolamina rubra]|uniref:glycosyltransferase family 2 protein n=1 Tax=Halolamina rubra TaxID=1380430 RepID=UPI0009E39C4F|nr:glycosyltransferase [Halolamina rubra]
MTIAAGVPVFQRTKALKRFLDSVPANIVDEVIVADNGNIDERSQLYERGFDYDLQILNLDYDVGIGASRNAIANACDHDYLLVADNDMEVPCNIDILVEIMNKSDLGGISGILSEQGCVRSGCRNIFFDDLLFDNKVLTIDIRAEPDSRSIAGHTVNIFDYITNASIIRKECFEDYGWDAELVDNEHLDFYTGHYVHTDWDFAVCSEVVFPHHKFTSTNYRRSHRKDTDKQKNANEKFKRKWQIDEIIWGARQEWIDTRAVPDHYIRSKLRTISPTSLVYLYNNYI